MSAILVLILALLAIHTGLKLELQMDKDEIKRMQEREQYLHEEMTRLLQETEGSSCSMENQLYCVLQQQWLFWVTAAALVLVLLAVGCCLIRRSKCVSASCRKQEGCALGRWLARRWKRGSASGKEQEGSSSKEKVCSEEKADSKEKEDLTRTEVLKELMDDLLGVCRVLSKRNFMPELHPATEMDSSIDDCSIQENGTGYGLLVILRPPPGHSFSLGTTEQPPARRIHVALECLCPRKTLLGNTCFLHPSDGQLPRKQDWYLLDTLCTDSFLDVEKVTCWVQMLVPSAWLLLPQSLHWQLTALPSSKCCRFQLSGPSGMQSSIEMALAVQPGSSAYLSLE